MKNILLLRGLTRQKAHWYDFPKKLEKASGYRVFHLELPGAGKYSQVVFPLKTEALVQFLNKQIEEFKKENEGEWHLVTISLGGMVALRYLECFPNSVSSACIINSSARDLSPIHHRMQLGVWKKILKVPFTKDAREQEENILSMVTNLLSEKKFKKVVDQFEKVQQENPMTLENKLRQLLWAYKNSSPKKIETPLYFLASRDDKLVNFSCSKELAHKYKSKIDYHATAGHDLPLDDSEWVIEKIKNFIQ